MPTLAQRALMTRLNIAAHGTPATVTPLHGAAGSTSIVWLYAGSNLGPGGAFELNEARRIVMVPKSDVPSLPVGSTVACAEVDGGPVKTWRVDGVDRTEADHHRVWLVPA